MKENGRIAVEVEYVAKHLQFHKCQHILANGLRSTR